MPKRRCLSCALIILNGGHSSRMGTDKGALPWGKGTMLTSLLTRSIAFPFSQTIISTNKPINLLPLRGSLYTAASPEPLTPAEASSLTAPLQLLWQLHSGTTRYITLVKDTHPDCGPLGGMEASFAEVISPMACVVSIDMPFYNFLPIRNWLYTLPVEMLKADKPIIVPVVHGTEEPLAAIYPRDILPQIQHALATGDYRVRQLFTGRTVWRQDESLYGPIFQNTNTPKAYKDAKAKALSQSRAVPVFSITADQSHTGKTTLCVALIQKLRDAGYRVGYIKSTHHQDLAPKEHSDTDRAERAGAQVCLCGPDNVPDGMDKKDYLLALSQTLPVDIAFIESRSHGTFPEIKVISGNYTEESQPWHSPVIAVVSDNELPESPQLHTFGRTDIDAIYGFITPFLSTPGKTIP